MNAIKDLFFTIAPKRLPKDRAVILMYHSISDADYFAAVSPQEFERQMAYLAERNYPVVSLAELVRRLKAGEPLGGAVAITFDDGYLDNLTVAYPILKEHHFPATIFVTSDLAGLLDKRNLKRLSVEEWHELEATGLISVEPHSKSHPHLSRLSNEQAQEEIEGSKRAIEQALGKVCRFFAAPYGDFSDETVELMRQTGFEAATTVREGTVAEDASLLELPRVSIDSSTSMVQFMGKLSTAVDWYARLTSWH